MRLMRQRLDVIPGAVDRARQQHDKTDGFGVDRTEVDGFGGFADRHRQLADGVGLPVRDREPLPDPRGAGLLARPYGFAQRLGVDDLARRVEDPDKLVDHAFLVRRSERRFDALE